METVDNKQVVIDFSARNEVLDVACQPGIAAIQARAQTFYKSGAGLGRVLFGCFTKHGKSYSI